MNPYQQLDPDEFDARAALLKLAEEITQQTATTQKRRELQAHFTRW